MVAVGNACTDVHHAHDVSDVSPSPQYTHPLTPS